MRQISYDNYTMAGDVALIATCAVIVILLMTSYIKRTRSFRIFMNIVFSLVVAAVTNIVYHFLLTKSESGLFGLTNALRILYQALLFDVFFLFVLYSTEVSGMEHRKARIIAIIASTILTFVVGIDIIRTIRGESFRIGADGILRPKMDVFMLGYVLYVILIAVTIYMVRHLLFKRVVIGFYGTMAVSVILWFGQLALNQSALNTMTFVFPVIAMLYILHSNPYNVTLGSVDTNAMEDMVRTMYNRKEPFVFISLLLPEYDVEGKELPKEFRALIRSHAVDYFRNSVLFQISNGHMIMIIPEKKNPNHELKIQEILNNFQQYYNSFHSPYKIIIGRSIEEISRKNEYISLIRSIERNMPDNTVHRLGPEDITRFNRDEKILQELTDIYNRRDVEDPRVLVYCQPVYNIKTGQFDTAEALMRLQIDDLGLVPPNQFIPMAENHEYIHVLTEIILNKTCSGIRKLMEKGYHISRISVNVSVIELKHSDFCSDIRRIISSNDISCEKIAIELTESRNESDFMVMKEKIDELREEGIRFYLDDFGTGYSNMERIMELPFDIIKFDRSLVIASGTGERSERIVENLAQMFNDMEYSVLYEGVEDDLEEERCREMSADYLQGFKYSRPIPIEELEKFLTKTA